MPTGLAEPGAFAGAWLASWTWFPSLALPVAILPSIYPSGRPESRSRRLFVWSGTVGIVGLCAALGLGPDAPGETVPGLTWSIPQPPSWVDVVVLVPTALALAVAVVGGLAAATIRAFRAGDPERQQMLWLLVPLWPYVVGYFFTLPWWLPMYAFVGVGVSIGVLRYRLLDIDLVVRRTLFYVPLVVLVACRRGWCVHGHRPGRAERATSPARPRPLWSPSWSDPSPAGSGEASTGSPWGCGPIPSRQSARSPAGESWPTVGILCPPSWRPWSTRSACPTPQSSTPTTTCWRWSAASAMTSCAWLCANTATGWVTW